MAESSLALNRSTSSRWSSRVDLLLARSWSRGGWAVAFDAAETGNGRVRSQAADESTEELDLVVGSGYLGHVCQTAWCTIFNDRRCAPAIPARRAALFGRLWRTES